MLQTLQDIKIKNIWNKHTIFIKILIIRGIGYRAFALMYQQSFNQNEVNNFQINDNNTNSRDLSNLYNHNYKRYIIIRAGHTLDLIQPISKNIFAITFKRERKLIIFGLDKQLINKISKDLYKYRSPSAYTGRGVRQKHFKVLRKEGKKDKQKGKGF